MKTHIYYLSFIMLVLNINCSYTKENMDLIELSRNSCVKISSESGNSRGSGFFIASDLVATCFHVIASITLDSNTINWKIYQDILITTATGEIISVNCISLPTQKDTSPLISDFAVLKLSKKPSNLKNYILEFSDDDIEQIKIGSDCYFSGHPLFTPALITHKGMISGINVSKSIICIQGSINKGNSGGALISNDGKLVGIISMREGGISRALEDLMVHIESTSKQGSVQLMGVDPLQAIKETVKTLNTYISTGIGYARHIRFLKEYSTNNNLVN